MNTLGVDSQKSQKSVYLLPILQNCVYEYHSNVVTDSGTAAFYWYLFVVKREKDVNLRTKSLLI
jgi:hypothetical protein